MFAQNTNNQMNQLFNSIDVMKEKGFTGFLTFNELWMSTDSISKSKGVYMVLYTTPEPPLFNTVGTGGHFKGRNPNILISELQNNWIDKTQVIYIGKAGGDGKSATLHSRLTDYLRFGQGKNVGHWGGRYIYQLNNPGSLVLCWKAVPNPSQYETQLI